MLLHLVDGTSADAGRGLPRDRGRARGLRRRAGATSRGCSALNKIDALDAGRRRRRPRRRWRGASGGRCIRLSGATGQGVPEVLRALRAAIEAARGATPGGRSAEPWRP